MKKLIVSTTAALIFATGAFANNGTDRIERALISSGQTELAQKYDSLSEAEKRKLVYNEDPWVRMATRNWIWSLYD